MVFSHKLLVSVVKMLIFKFKIIIFFLNRMQLSINHYNIANKISFNSFNSKLHKFVRLLNFVWWMDIASLTTAICVNNNKQPFATFCLWVLETCFHFHLYHPLCILLQFSTFFFFMIFALIFQRKIKWLHLQVAKKKYYVFYTKCTQLCRLQFQIFFLFTVRFWCFTFLI